MKTKQKPAAGASGTAVPLERVEIDHSTQTRAHIHPEVVSEYKEHIETSAAGGIEWPFPPVTLFEDATGKCWIGDGFHRCLAALAAGLEEVRAEVREGGREDALRFALGANAHHGLRRTREDIRRAVELADDAWPELTNNAIAELVGVSNHTVAKYRPERVGPKTAADGRQMVAPTGKAAHKPKEEADPSGLPPEDPTDGFEWVEVGERPTLGEVEAWVDPIPTWGELAEGSGIEVRVLPAAAGGETEQVRRDLVVEWCRMPVGDDGKARWDGFRRVPVSIEHAKRERDRAAAEERMAGGVDWLRKLRDVMVLEVGNSEAVFAATGTVLARQAAKHAPTEALRLAARARGIKQEEYEAQLRGTDGDIVDALCVLVATELHAYGHEQVEQTVIGEILDALA